MLFLKQTHTLHMHMIVMLLENPIVYSINVDSISFEFILIVQWHCSFANLSWHNIYKNSQIASPLRDVTLTTSCIRWRTEYRIWKLVHELHTSKSHSESEHRIPDTLLSQFIGFTLNQAMTFHPSRHLWGVVTSLNIAAPSL